MSVSRKRKSINTARATRFHSMLIGQKAQRYSGVCLCIHEEDPVPLYPGRSILLTSVTRSSGHCPHRQVTATGISQHDPRKTKSDRKTTFHWFWNAHYCKLVLEMSSAFNEIEAASSDRDIFSPGCFHNRSLGSWCSNHSYKESGHGEISTQRSFPTNFLATLCSALASAPSLPLRSRSPGLGFGLFCGT